MSAGRLLVLAGVLLVVVGAVVIMAERAGVRLGRLPGDFVWRGRNSAVYFPLATSILVSLVLTLIFWVVGKMQR
jgi:hypothetical protein